MTRLNSTMIALFTSTLLAGTASANVLANSGFEAGTGADAADWAEIVGGPSGFVGRSDLMPRTGDYSAYMSFDHINNPAAGGAYFIEQNQGVGSIMPGSPYDLSFYAKMDSTDFVGMDAFVQILWLDQDASHGGGVQGEMLTSLVGLGINTDYQQFSFDGMEAPDGADSFILRFQLSAGAVDGIANGLYIDDASLTKVPTPSALGLLAMGGLLTGARRRR